MIDVILFLSAWYVVGVIGVALFLEFGLLREGLDVRLGELVWGALLAASGPCVAFVGVVFMVSYFMPKAPERCSIDFDRIVIKARKK